MFTSQSRVRKSVLPRKADPFVCLPLDRRKSLDLRLPTLRYFRSQSLSLARASSPRLTRHGPVLLRRDLISSLTLGAEIDGSRSIDLHNSVRGGTASSLKSYTWYLKARLSVS